MSKFLWTEVRLDWLRAVAEGAVTYDRLDARWMRDDEELTGWDGRTLNELLRKKFIAVADDGTVIVTKVGQSTMDTICR